MCLHRERAMDAVSNFPMLLCLDTTFLRIQYIEIFTWGRDMGADYG